MFYAENGSTADVLATLDQLRAWVHELTVHNMEVGSELSGRAAGPYPERLATLVLTGRFLDDYLEMIDRWAAWAAEIVAAWPPEPGEAAPDLAGWQAPCARRPRGPSGGAPASRQVPAQMSHPHRHPEPTRPRMRLRTQAPSGAVLADR